MAWDEWEQLKAEVAERHSVKMHLNQAGEDPSGGSGGVRSSKAAWIRAGEGVGVLGGNIKNALSKLEQEQKGAEANREVLSAVAQQEVYQSWNEYLTRVRGRCGALRNLLEKTGHDQFKNDDAIREAFNALGEKYEDTDSGYHGQGR
ncbi:MULTISPECIES: hypothetical protein [unclassified Streptomyces]|uniref:hypothetical protein n=1 Tax=unclassified Streptomyces TaxID=2593676 RepID=UPI0035D94BB5